MTPSRWRGDCSRCAALCCLSLAFDRSESFAFDKPAGEPCPLLAAEHACSIHAERSRRGFSGCVAYDCGGAGQRVSEEVFGGRSWQTEPSLVRPMLEAFCRMRRVNELLAGLALTDRVELSAEQQRRRQELERLLDPLGGFDCETLKALELNALTRDVRQLLAGQRERLASRTEAGMEADRERRRLPLVKPPVAVAAANGRRQEPQPAGRASIGRQ